MRLRQDLVTLSATDLANHLACRHLTHQEVRRAFGQLEKQFRDDHRVKRLVELGNEHERNYVEHLRQSGLSIADWTDSEAKPDLQRTVDAMKEGVDVIVQARLESGRWNGYADILLRVDRKSELGDWSYEAVDTKLTSNTKGGTILQLCLYSEIIGELQGIAPISMHVVSPSDEFDKESFRYEEFAAYYRFVKKQLEEAVALHEETIAADAPTEPVRSNTYPYPVEHCDVCNWWSLCDKQRRDDDHLSFVATCSRLHVRELEEQSIKTLEDLALIGTEESDPKDASVHSTDEHEQPSIPFSPTRGSTRTFEKLQRQAVLQYIQRETNEPQLEVIDEESRTAADNRSAGFETESRTGLSRLPEPDPGDVFFDIEGDRFVGNGGLEYLFGYAVADETPVEASGMDDKDVHPVDRPTGDRKQRYQYRALWAFEPEGTVIREKRMFEEFIDWIVVRRKHHPGMHIYHYNHYEPTNIKRLMSVHATREDEVDELLRAGVFVDLYTVVRQAIRAGVEGYSIKNLEQYYGFHRSVDLREDASPSLRALERALELGEPAAIDPETRAAVEGYNRDDCLSTAYLRDWLEELRLKEIRDGAPIERPPLKPGDASESVSDKLQASRAVSEQLARDLPEDRDSWTVAEHGRWLLSELLEWHRREAKVTSWEYHRLKDMSEEDLYDERAAIAGLKLERIVDKSKRLYEYSYPRQETKVQQGKSLKPCDAVWLADEAPPASDAGDDGADPIERKLPKIGDVESIDTINRRIVLKKPKKFCDYHPEAVFLDESFYSNEQEAALLRFGTAMAAGLADRGTSGDAEELVPPTWRAAWRLLSRQYPTALLDDVESLKSPLDKALHLAPRLDGDVLAIQGPPGSGKTYTGARMICELVSRGKKVGISAISHKVVRNLLDEVIRESEKLGQTFACVQKPSKVAKKDDQHPRILEVGSNKDMEAAIAGGDAWVFGGTSYLWSRQEFADALDVLIVDEAGQMSLANVLAVSQAGASLVLLGDPAQLDQPQKAAHPEGTDASALEYVLDGADVMPTDRGLFIDETRRLHPSICELTSELFYDGKLRSMAGLERQRIDGSDVIPQCGLYYLPVDHDGNRNESIEEVESVKALVDSLTRVGGAKPATWTNADGVASPISLDDILIVAPYNAHVTLLQSAMHGARVGTVDKFQGQEAPIVIYSLASSSPEDAPRGMDFLYSLNRLNVATSRAKCACVLVASPRLLEAECRTPKQMRLANALVRYVEMAERVVGF